MSCPPAGTSADESMDEVEGGMVLQTLPNQSARAGVGAETGFDSFVLFRAWLGHPDHPLGQRAGLFSLNCPVSGSADGRNSLKLTLDPCATYWAG